MKKNFKFKGLAVLRSDLYDLYTSTVPVVETISTSGYGIDELKARMVQYAK